MARNDRPLVIILAGHNGSGKSTLWYERIAEQSRIPLINTDRVLLSLLPQALPAWALAIGVADAAILCDNSTVQGDAFTIAHMRRGQEVAFDIQRKPNPPKLILRWLDVVAPEGA